MTHFEKIPTVPTADEILDVSLRRAAQKMRAKSNKKKANEEFVSASYDAIHMRLVAIIQSFPEISLLPLFYQDLVEILYGTDRLKKSLGAVGWAARWAYEHGRGFSKSVKYADANGEEQRKQAIARLASVVHQIDSELHFLNDVRNVLRKLPHVEDCFTVVIAGYPNVGKSSFIRSVSSAEPEIASYPFTTKGIIVGHCHVGREKIQFIDTPGLLDRSEEERNVIEQQAIAAIMHISDRLLIILDPSEHCGYDFDAQIHLCNDLHHLTHNIPITIAANKCDIFSADKTPADISAEVTEKLPWYAASHAKLFMMSTHTGVGVDEVFNILIQDRPIQKLIPTPLREDTRDEIS
ncbi:MAG: 50S ribosome-binding GTPase [Methanomicrobiales archaeon]|jgi:nucleolar GTP-binding protein|nr:50S ribosome-binding GTPase [Methanomicrobiales archaeon]